MASKGLRGGGSSTPSSVISAEVAVFEEVSYRGLERRVFAEAEESTKGFKCECHWVGQDAKAMASEEDLHPSSATLVLRLA